MAELDAITELLRLQRRDLEMQLADAASRGEETAELVSRIEDLRRRVEDTQRRLRSSAAGSIPEDDVTAPPRGGGRS